MVWQASQAFLGYNECDGSPWLRRIVVACGDEGAGTLFYCTLLDVDKHHGVTSPHLHINNRPKHNSTY